MAIMLFFILEPKIPKKSILGVEFMKMRFKFGISKLELV